MLLFSVTLEISWIEGELPPITLAVDWWDPLELMTDRRFRNDHEKGCHSDWTAVLSREELIELSERYRRNDTLALSSAERSFLVAQTTLDLVVSEPDSKTGFYRVIVSQWNGFS